MINRGNYRSWVFEEEGAKESFEVCLAEAAERSGWLVHAWVVMGNHFHLAVETPKANLSSGMQWLQVTFAARFNRFRGEQGRLFQGRFRGLLVEAGEALGRVCHYIELNPVRAGILPAGELEKYRFSSFARLWDPKRRPEWYVARSSLEAAGGLADTAKGRAKYRDYLAWLTEEMRQDREEAYQNLSRGWAVGSDEFKADLLEKYGQKVDDQSWEGMGRKAWREGQWEARLQKLLQRVPEKKRQDQRVSALWKAELAWQMKTQTDASNPWLAARLAMGSPTYVSKMVGLVRKVKGK